MNRRLLQPLNSSSLHRTAMLARVMLPAVFLREVLGWEAESLERIRSRRWADLTDDAAPAPWRSG